MQLPRLLRPRRRALFVLLALFTASLVHAGLPAKPFAMDNGVGRGAWSAEQQASVVRELGYTGISYNYTTPADLRVWLAELGKRELVLTALYFGLRLDGPDPLPPGMPEAMELLRGSATVLWLTIPKAPNKTDGELQAATLPRLRDVADRAQRLGLRIALYPHKGFHLATAEQAFALARESGRENVFVTLNLCHELAAGNGARLHALAAEVAPRLAMVSINGATDQPGPGWDNYIKLLGTGDYDVGALLRTLTKLGYSGPVGIQFYNIKGDARANLETTIRAWNALRPQ